MVNGYIPDRIYEDIDSPVKKNCDGGKACTCSPKDKLQKKITPLNAVYLCIALLSIYHFGFKNKKRSLKK